MKLIRNLNWQMTIALGLISLGAATGLARAEDKPAADLTVGVYSKYVWRGFELSDDSLVIQPSLTVGYKGFGVNLWGNLDTDQYNMDSEAFNWNETDLTLSYDGAIDKFGYALGYIYYDLEGLADSQEVYLGFSLDTLLSPALTIYREIANYQGWYVTLGISHSFPLSETIGLDLGAQVSYLDVEATDHSEFHDGLLSAAISIPLTDLVSISPELYWSFPLTSEASDLREAASISGDDSYVYGGLSMSLAF